MLIIAHRGFSGRQPEMTRAAYIEAIDWAEQTGTELGLECDVHFSADDQLICLHDLRLDRTSNARGPAYARTVRQLRRLDFGSWRVRRPNPAQRAMVTLTELLELVAEARGRQIPVSLVIETKHPNPRGLEVEERVAAMLEPYGWHAPGSPVRVITFFAEAVHRLGHVLPGLERTLLIEKTLGSWADGHLPAGVRIAGPDLELVRQDPGYVARAREAGNEVHVWTVNHPDDVRFCHDLGVTGITTDVPDVVAATLDHLVHRRE